MISVLGDLHIPDRAKEIPEAFCNILRESELILCTGDLVTQEVLDELHGYGRVVAVQGNMDQVELPEREVVDPELVDPEGRDPESVDPEGRDPESVDPESVDPESVYPEGRDPESVGQGAASGAKIGLFHGTGVSPRGDAAQLSQIAKDMGVEVLISGHTHRYSVQEYDDVLLLNPGSATGAWGGNSSGGNPSMMTLKIEGKKIYIRKHELTSTSGDIVQGEIVHELK